MRFTSTIAIGLLAGLASCRVVPRKVVTKPIVAHYMVGGVSEAHVVQDIKDAQTLGLDGFALNYDQFKDWSNATVRYMFDHADELGFNLFFSFDHGAGMLTGDPMQYADYYKSYSTRTSYMKIKDPKDQKNKPIVSTFGGEESNDKWNQFKTKVGDVLIIPGFSEVYNPTSSFFDSRGSIDGVFNWNSWPSSTDGKVTVSSKNDQTFQNAAHAKSKLFMMGLSPVQFKHLNNDNNWYRRGEDNLENRFGQILDLQPDLIQLQSWNDAGEGHYMGNIWPEPLNQRTKDLTDDYPHQAYWKILGPFITAWKNGDRTTTNMVPTGGKAVQGTFWHHTLTVDGTCTADAYTKTPGITSSAEDAVSGVVLVPKGKTNLVAVVNVGTQQLNKTGLDPGFNKFKFTGLEKLAPGKVQLEVWDGSTMVGGGYGSLEVKKSQKLCNYQFQVVGLA